MNKIKTSILQVHNLCKTYHLDKSKDLHVRAISEISFDLFDSEFVCVVGESGSGKSTLLHCLGSYEKPDPECTDSVQFLTENGQYASIWRNAGWYRQNFIGVVFQSFHLLPNFRLWENVEIPLLLSKSAQWEPDRSRRRTYVHSTLQQLGIGDKGQSRISELSGGECQRAAIARALVKRPKLIFADEPTGNLDEKTTGIIVEELNRLCDQGVSVLMVTHNQKIAKKYADRIITLRDGRIESDEHISDSSKLRPCQEKFRRENEDKEKITVRNSQENTTVDISSEVSDTKSVCPSLTEAAKECEKLNKLSECVPHVCSSKSKEVGIEETSPQSKKRELFHKLSTAIVRTLSKAHLLWPTTIRALRRLRLPSSELRLLHLLRFALRDMRESYTSLFTNITAILFGTVLSALLLGLVFGSKEIMKNVIGKIPNIEAVSVWIDYGTGADPITKADVNTLAQKPGVLKVVSDVKQMVFLYESEPKDYYACLAGTQPGDPEVERLKFVKGSNKVDPDGWDVILTEQVATELNYFDPLGLVGKTVIMEMRRYSDLRSPEETTPKLVLKYPLKVVGIVKFSPKNRIYASMNLVRFAHDFSWARSEYIPEAGDKIDGTKISDRTFYEGLKLHYANPQEAERRYLELRKEIGAQYEVDWLGKEYLWLRDVQFIAFLVFVGFGLLTVIAGSISVFNTLQASVFRKIREIGILRSLGVSRVDVFSVFVFQSLIIGFLAAIGGLFLTFLAIPFVNKTVGLLAKEQWKLEVDLSTLLILPGNIALFILLAVSFVCVTAAFYPSWRAGRITPMDAIRATGV